MEIPILYKMSILPEIITYPQLPLPTLLSDTSMKTLHEKGLITFRQHFRAIMNIQKTKVRGLLIKHTTPN